MKNSNNILGQDLARLPYFDWDKAKDFYYVAKLGSFSEAGKFLNISQSSLSRKIKILEDHLNFKVFTRLPHGLELTRKGEELFAIIERTFLELKGLNYNSAVMANNGQKRKIRIATTHAIAAYILSDHIIAYNKQHPNVMFEIISDDHMIDIILNDVDITIRPFNKNAVGVEQDHLFTLEKKLYASEEYLSQYGEPKNIEDLKNHHIIAPARTESYPYSDLNWILRLGMPKEKMHDPIFTSTLLECLIEAAKNGLGIIGGYEQMSILKKSGLKNILPDICDTSVKWFCTYPQSFKNDQQIEHIRNYLHKWLT